MTNLDEIEVEAADCESDADSTNWIEDHAALIIRAVRQLGAERKALKDGLIDELVPPLDPDVLELIRAGESDAE